MTDYRFSVIVPSEPMSHDQALDAADKLAEAGCTDASVRGHVEGMELLFERSADSMQVAISSAIANVESVGYKVSRVMMEREAIPG